jgi:hypothetical protein
LAGPITIFFLFASTFLTLLSINLLIAIICDTFDNVLSKEKSNSNYERACLIYKYENKMTNKEKKSL